MSTLPFSARPTLEFDPQIGQATARRTYLRERADGYESREELSARVAGGNVLLPYIDERLQAQTEKVQNYINAVLDGRRFLVEEDEDPAAKEFLELYDALRTGGLLTAGRHLQHADPDLPHRSIETSTNCSTSASSTLKFLLLLNGSGVGRLYDDDVCLVDWSKQPKLHLVLSKEHADYGENIDGSAWQNDFIAEEDLDLSALIPAGETAQVIRVKDSREGWAKAVEAIENITFERTLGKDTYGHVVLNFSDVRPKGTPIGGMQDRPASGPVPLMCGLKNISELRGSDLEPWETTMMVDHELAAIVVVGGVRRSARIAVKHWKDAGIFRYIEFKRRLENRTSHGLYYWSSNNSVGVDEEFWKAVRKVESELSRHHVGYEHFAKEDVIGYIDTKTNTVLRPGAYEEHPKAERLEPIIGAVYSPITYENVSPEHVTETELHAANVYLAATSCAYYDQTGEPGFLNVDQIDQNREGLDEMLENLMEDPNQVIGYRADEDIIDGGFSLSGVTQDLYVRLAEVALEKPNYMIVNPCGEIALNFMGGYCTIGSLNAANLVRNYERVGERSHEEVEAELTHLAKLQTRFLMRVNNLDALYKGEVKRTQRIGVGLCSPHEFYMAQYGLSFDEVVDEEVTDYLLGKSDTFDWDLVGTEKQKRAIDFWLMIGRVSKAVNDEAVRYADELGVNAPHTTTMIAPNGSTGKLFNTTEGAHLPGMLQYLRNTQFSQSNKQVDEYRDLGYPVTELNQYQGVSIVGFPTKPFITVLAERLGLKDKLTTASEASIESQYRWLQLLERFWIRGGTPEGPTHVGGQTSYTLKIDTNETDYSRFLRAMQSGQANVRCCSVIIQQESSPDPHGVVEYITGIQPKTGGYEYLPEQSLPEEVFDHVMAQIREQADEDIGREHLECEGGACPITFKD